MRHFLCRTVKTTDQRNYNLPGISCWEETGLTWRLVGQICKRDRNTGDTDDDDELDQAFSRTVNYANLLPST